MIELVIFDMDGVIFEGQNFWLDLHRAMGTEKEAWRLWRNLAKTDYVRLSRITAEKLWRHKSADGLWRLIRDRKPVAGISQVFGYLQANAIKTAVVSSGPYQLAERAQRMYGVDLIRANRLEIGADGTFTGQVEVQVDENHKDTVAQELMNALGIPADSTAMIGDSHSDAAMARVVGLPIAYDAEDKKLLKNCPVHLSRGRLSEAIRVLRDFSLRPSRIVAR